MADKTVELFRRLDENQDGTVTRDELKRVFKFLDPLRMDNDRLDMLLHSVDTNKDGAIQYSEFVMWLQRQENEWEKTRKSRVFQEGWTFKSSDLVSFNKGDVENVYEVQKKELGEGSFGSVYLGVHKVTKATRAIKYINKERTDKNAMEAEMGVMKTLDHPNLIKMYEIYEDPRTLYLVMEVCSGGELFDAIVQAGKFTEKQAARLMSQILGGTFYMHKQCVVHRDLKPENFLLYKKGPIDSASLKIIDFGLARAFTPGIEMKTMAGTPMYIAPQVLIGQGYDHQCDIWSCGVIAYVFLSGRPPFLGRTENQTCKIVRVGKYQFPAAHWTNVSEDAKDLIRACLKFAPSSRCSAQEALKHPWILEQAPHAPTPSLGESHIEAMKKFRGSNKLRKAALGALARVLEEDEIKPLKEAFIALDQNGDGTVTLSEFEAGVRKSGKLGPTLQALMKDIDFDRNDTIDYTEFLASTLTARHCAQERACWAAFHAFDLDGSGHLSRKEICKVLSHCDVEAMWSKKVIDEVLKDFDADGDGKLSFKEFVAMLRSKK